MSVVVCTASTICGNRRRLRFLWGGGEAGSSLLIRRDPLWQSLGIVHSLSLYDLIYDNSCLKNNVQIPFSE